MSILGPYQLAGATTLQLFSGRSYLLAFNVSDHLLSVSIQPAAAAPISFLLPARAQRSVPLSGSSAQLSWTDLGLQALQPVGLQQLYFELIDAAQLASNELPLIAPLALTGVTTPSMSNLNNDGNPGGTVFVEATVGGDTASSVSLQNQGILQLGSGQNGHVGQIRLAQAAPLGIGGIIQGSALISGRNLQIVGLDTNGFLNLQVDDGGQIRILDKNGNLAALYDIAHGSLGLLTYPIQVNASSGGSGYLIWSMPFGYNDPNAYKRFLAELVGFKNGSTTISLSLPFPFSTHVRILAGDIPGVQLLHAGTAVTVSVFLPGATSPTTTTTVSSGCNGWYSGPVDTVTFANNNATAHSGFLLLEGY
ncbi:MAG: hypothetical protein IMW90_15100 [Thermogemmatispora sp.]|uniref:hypothetical protein n=1 Tax=Thermogemmatispora sp. TaxID=1968838 RepID=UPI001A03A1F3|nr:hypothetical protein [Thermogemmatispora sp.]MBE3567045.1 hypothetical protein [Thermogemmatispora sp.]